MDKNNDNSPKACPNCMALNPPEAEFCQKCRCPIGGYVNIEPVKQIEATGFLYKRATHGPIKPIVVWGVWVFVGSGFLAGSVISVMALMTEDSRPAALYTVPVTALLGVLIYKVTRNYFRHKKHKKASG